ncbi:MAG TPA: hypothetical protein PK323_14170 [Bacteroidia bacterium]|nr:hypothetical protein [Bacteroidia bacterium]
MRYINHVCVLFLYVFIFNTCNKKHTPTFEKDVAQIIYTNCTKCHNPNGVAPFSLTNYDNIKKRAKAIAFVTKNRMMPPWPADPNYTHFVGENLLTDEQIEILQQWLNGGCVAGDLNKAPLAPEFKYKSYLGKPDLVLEYRDTVFLKGNNLDQFFLMKFPYQIDRDTIVKAIEFVPGNTKVVHHVNGHIIQYDEGKKSNIFGGKNIISSESIEADQVYQLLDVANDDGSYPMLTQSAVNYLPGVLPTVYPEGLSGFKLHKQGAFLFKDIHYGPTSRDTFDVSRINVFFTKKMPKRVTRELQMGTLGITDIEPPLVIPPNQIKRFVTKAKINKDISILTINPHMHKLGKSFWAYAIQQNGDTIPLIKIRKWDFNWQYFYTFKKMIKIPAGSTIIVEGIFDNTIQNKNNPFHPPREVAERAGSMRASDEMFQFIITLMDYESGDENISLEP